MMIAQRLCSNEINAIDSKEPPHECSGQTWSARPHQPDSRPGSTHTRTPLQPDSDSQRRIQKAPAATCIQPRRYFLSLRLGRASCSSTWKRSRLPRTKFKEETGAASLRGKFFLNRGCFQEGGILRSTCMWKRRRGVEEEATERAVEGSRHGFQATVLS